jgi:hypothetical protein
MSNILASRKTLQPDRKDQPQPDFVKRRDAIESADDHPRRGDARQVERDDQPILHARGQLSGVPVLQCHGRCP